MKSATGSQLLLQDPDRLMSSVQPASQPCKLCREQSGGLSSQQAGQHVKQELPDIWTFTPGKGLNTLRALAEAYF